MIIILILVIVMDEGNIVTGNGTYAAISFIESSYPGVLASQSMIKIGNEKNVETYIKVCGVIDTLIDSGSPPDVIVDLTNKDNKIIRSVSLSLGIPTVTTTSMAIERMT